MEWDNQRSSVSSTPNSMTSQSTSNSNQRTDKVPTLQQILPSTSVSALSKLTDDDLRRKGPEDLVRILRRVESDYKSLLGEHGNIVKDVNRRYQIFVLESRGFKEVNQKLQDDNQELRDLCCFLDDDRQRGRKLAREWQRFGRYTASVMRSEVAVYQEKLHELEERQCELVKENMELKELCLFLDQERGGRASGDRDDGDGSSNGTVTGHEDGVIPMDTGGLNAQVSAYNPSGSHSSGSTNYIRELEQKVHKLEEEKRLLAQRINRNSAEGLDESTRDRTLVHETSSNSMKIDEQLMHGSDGSKSPNPRKPESVVHAMKVLHIHEELEKTPTEDENLDATEKAIVREMCNVVWRKLGDAGDTVSFNDSSDSILEPPAIPPMGAAQSKINPPSHNQSHSFTISQPQPQMASTPLASNVKAVASHHIHDNQKYHPERQVRNQPPLRPSQAPNQPLQPPLRPSQAPNQPLHHNMLPHLPAHVDSRKNAYTDVHETVSSKPLDQSEEEKSRFVRANPFCMPQPFPRPNNQSQHRDFKPIPSQLPSSRSAPQMPPSSEENLPPHFQSHRHRRLQQQPQGPQQQQHFPLQNAPTVPIKSHSPINDNLHSHVLRTESSSSTPANVQYHSNPSYQNPQTSLPGSQQYPHHPVRLLQAPDSQASRVADSRMSGDESNQIFNKHSTGSHHDSNLSRRDAAMSEPNVSAPVMFRRGREIISNNREASSSQIALRPSGSEHDRKGPPVGKSMPSLRGQIIDNSSTQHLPSSRQQTMPQASHPVKGGFLAYPRSGPPMSVQAPMSPHIASNNNPNSRLGYSQSEDISPRARSDGSRMYQQQEWRQTYLDDSDTL